MQFNCQTCFTRQSLIIENDHRYETGLVSEEKSETISIPASVFKMLQEKIKGTRVSSVSEYVTNLLIEILADSDKPEKREGEVFSKADQEAVDKRLRALGYVD